MLDKARGAAAETDLSNVEFRKGFGEELPVDDGWADVVISNGVFNLMPDKPGAIGEMYRVLNAGRLRHRDQLPGGQVAMVLPGPACNVAGQCGTIALHSGADNIH